MRSFLHSISYSSFIIFAIICVAFSFSGAVASDPHLWSKDDKDYLASLRLESSPPPADPSNRYSVNRRAALLGKKLFFDTRFSKTGKVSCGTCHLPEYEFTDRLPHARGTGEGTRRTMTLVGVGYNRWFFWDGRKDSLWSQALGPIESPLEHGISRTYAAKVIEKCYRQEYESVFGKLPGIEFDKLPTPAMPANFDASYSKAWNSMARSERKAVNSVFVNMGKAIGAYVRTILPAPSRFDRYVGAVLRGDRETMEKTYSPDEAIGLRLFIGKGQCLNCHNGPLLTDGEFHDIGLSPDGTVRGRGREKGIGDVLSDEFNCLTSWSDADENDCSHLKYVDVERRNYRGAFKTPTLRNISERPPYMHTGQFNTLRDVLRFYRSSTAKEIKHGSLSDRELGQIETFLKTLTGKSGGF